MKKDNSIKVKRGSMNIVSIIIILFGILILLNGFRMFIQQLKSGYVSFGLGLLLGSSLPSFLFMKYGLDREKSTFSLNKYYKYFCIIMLILIVVFIFIDSGGFCLIGINFPSNICAG